MGLFGKIKDILFEEVVEEENNTKTIKEEKKEPIFENKEVKKEYPQYMDTPSVERVEKVDNIERLDTPPVSQRKEEYLGERELFQQESSSPFLDFDEEEFSNLLVSPNNRQTNVIEYERKKKKEKRTDYGRMIKSETRETVERKKFKPSPIISPVYGILNEDYRIEDIKNREDDNLDIEKVRKKAFEPEEKPEKIDLYEEETVTVKYDEDEETKIKKGKTIDDLLADTSDEVIDIKDKPDLEESIEYVDEDNTKEMKIEEDKKEEVIEDIDDTEDEDESNVFDLIDSIYESREDGE